MGPRHRRRHPLADRFGLLSITDIASSSPKFLPPAVSTYPLILGVGDSTDVVIRLEPTGLGAKSGLIEIFSKPLAVLC